MKRSILEELACGNISPEPRFIKKNSKYDRTLKCVVDAEAKLIALLNEQQKEALNAFTHAQESLNELSNIDRFVYGYKFGALSTMEVFNGRDDLIVGSEI